MRAWLRFVAVFLAFFLPVYLGCGLLNGWQPQRAVRLHADWEREIPLVPWMVWPYLSLYTAYLMPLFHLDQDGMRALTRQTVAAVIVAGIVFLALPATTGFPPRGEAHGWMIGLLGAVDTPYNLVPSLHVACAALILLACGERTGPPLRAFYVAWLAVLVASTLLVHQHHVIDVVAGLGLALALRRLWPLPAPATVTP